MKKRFTRIVACIALTAMVVSLAACGSKDKPATSGTTSSTSSSDKANFKPVEWRMSNQHPEAASLTPPTKR